MKRIIAIGASLSLLLAAVLVFNVLEVRPSMAAPDYDEEYEYCSQYEYYEGKPDDYYPKEDDEPCEEETYDEESHDEDYPVEDDEPDEAVACDEEEQSDSDEPEIADVTLDAAPLIITPQNHVFPPARVGYGEQAAQIFTITNIGAVPLWVSEETADMNFFYSSAGNGNTNPVAPGGTFVARVNPVVGLPVGTHTAEFLTRFSPVEISSTELENLALLEVAFTVSFTVTDGAQRHYPAGIIELPTTPHVRPVPQLMGWSTNGNFGVFEDFIRDESAEPDFAGIVTNSTLTLRDFVTSREFVIEFYDDVSLDGVFVTTVSSPAFLWVEFEHGTSLNHLLRLEGNRLIFDIRGSIYGGEFYFYGEDAQYWPYCIYFMGIESFNIARVYLVF
ncbi:MAG: hypothetical protein FWE19_03610 [Oscillospiraceae bacterium]|nr:hypothetical protein [Oscillospiraceae bacterium]